MGGDAVASSCKRIWGILKPDSARPASSAGSCSTPATAGNTGASLASGKDGALAPVLLMTRFLTVLVLAATLGLPLAGVFGFLVVLLLRPFPLAGLVLRRGIFDSLRFTRRTGRAAAFTASPARGLFVLIPSSDPCDGSRILSDVTHNTATAMGVQCEFPPAHLCENLR
jgi:hypothetical protein